MKILMFSAMPFDETSISEILINNYIGNNIGNVLFQDSVPRWIMDEDTEITRTKMSRQMTQKEIDECNEKYDMFILPLANALRTEFIRKMSFITHLVKGLKIPCVVVGIGIQRELNDTAWNFPFDEPTKEFFKAVLEKSAIIGVRGEITAHYLQHIGFTPEKDFTVIGCPSLYTYGYNLPKPLTPELTTASPVSFNSNVQNGLYTFLEREASKFDDANYICTVRNELRMLYCGYPYPAKDMKTIVPATFPVHFDNKWIQNDRIISFVDRYSWLEFLKTKQFSFGSRVHGTIANILAGTPCFIFVRDERVAELADYHNIPHMALQDIKDSTNIFDIYERTDFSSILDGHNDRVNHYVNFLDKNNVPHLPLKALSGETPFDRYNKQFIKGPIRHFVNVSPEEQERRLAEYYLALWKIRKDARKELTSLEKKYDKLSKENAALKASKFYKLQQGWNKVKNKLH